MVPSRENPGTNGTLLEPSRMTQRKCRAKAKNTDRDSRFRLARPVLLKRCHEFLIASVATVARGLLARRSRRPSMESDSCNTIPGSGNRFLIRRREAADRERRPLLVSAVMTARRIREQI